MLHYYKFKDFTKNPLLQENLLHKYLVPGVLSTISRYSTITRYTITRGDCSIYSLTEFLINKSIKDLRNLNKIYESYVRSLIIP